MPTNYPNNYDDYFDPDETTYQDDDGFLHDVHHSNLNDAVEALEHRVGKVGETNAASFTQRVAVLEASGSLYSAENKQGSTISGGMVVATHTSGTGIVKADAIGIAKRAVGFLRDDTLSTVAGDVQTDGIITKADWSAVIGAATLTRGPYFLDASAPGTMTQSPDQTTGNIVQALGVALSTTEFDISIQPPILL